ncbi:MAG TPA: photosystem I assembly BtpA [Clostridiales bacterium]|nr:photosystem I assembly BtpA [Clostridiales bacterium]
MDLCMAAASMSAPCWAARCPPSCWKKREASQTCPPKRSFWRGTKQSGGMIEMEWNLTGGRKLLIGMIHCLPLPGTYGATATIDEVIARAVSDAKALERVGFDAVMIENEDLCLEPHMTKVQFSAISMVAQAVRSAVKLPLGLCCSGLNYEEALSIAKVVGGDFIRTPIFVDTVMNYNGIMTPCSGKIIRYRREISAEHVKIFADVQVKHYYMVNPEVDIATSAKWAQHQGADAVIVTGCSTGTETASSDLEKVKNSISIPVAVGSGVTEKNIAEKMQIADILIVGTTLRRNGSMAEPIDEAQARALLRAAGREV